MDQSRSNADCQIANQKSAFDCSWSFFIQLVDFIKELQTTVLAQTR